MWDQDKLKQSKILVVGAGALGNEVLKNLALVGIGNITVIDFDEVSKSNLSRSILFQESDIGFPKSEVACKKLLEINPEIIVQSILGDLEFDIGVGDIQRYHLIVGCLDSVNARWSINKLAYRAGVPWINGGIGVTKGEISFFDPSTESACYECTISDQMWNARNQRYSCQGMKLDVPETAVPTTATLASTVGAIQVQQVLMYLHGKDGLLKSGEKIFLDLGSWNCFKVQLQRQGSCINHDLFIHPRLTLEYTSSTTMRNIFERINDLGFPIQTLWLRNKIALGVICSNPNCRYQEKINVPLKKYSVSKLPCPNCNSDRFFKNVEFLSIDDEPSIDSLTVEDLCLPENEILHCETEEGVIAIQFSRVK